MQAQYTATKKPTCQTCSCGEASFAYRYPQPLEDWQLRPVSIKHQSFIDTFKSKTSTVPTEVADHPKPESDSKKDKQNKHHRSDSSSSEEITIKINLKKALEKTKKKKHKTINICAQEDSDDGSEYQKIQKPEEKPVKQKKEILKQPESIPTQVQEPKKEDQPPQTIIKKETIPEKPADVMPAKPVEEKPAKRPEEPKQIKQEATTVKPETSNPQSDANALSALGLGIKVVQSSKTLTVKPKIVKNASELDPRLNELALTLTNKNATPDMKESSIKKFREAVKDLEFVKVGLTDKGREEQLPDIDSQLLLVRPSALKLYVVESETPAVVGGLHWDSMDALGKLNKDIFKFTILKFENPDDEKEITKTLKSCIKATKAD